MRCSGGAGGFAVFLRIDRRFRERHRHDLAGLIAAARQDDDAAAIDREVAGALDSRALRVADVIEPADELCLAHVLAGLKCQRAREDSGYGAVSLAVQALVDDAAVRHVEIRDGAEHDHAQHAQADRDPALVGRQQRGPAEARKTNAPAASFFLLPQIVKTQWWPMASGSSSIKRSTRAGP